MSHSLSPVIQNAAIDAAAVDGIYLALRCGQGELAGLLRGIALAGGGGNVTLPHKEAAAALVDERSAAVRRTGACNTFWLEDSVIHGDNTDVAGFLRALAAIGGGSPSGARVLLLGAGGAARAVLAALMDEGADQVLVLNRTLSRAQAVATRVGDQRVRVVPSPDQLADESVDIVVNTTSLGLSPDDPLPLDLSLLSHIGALLDLAYGLHEPPLVTAARQRGIPCADGMEMLVAQGAASFEKWWRREAPLDAMRAALRQALARRSAPAAD